MKVYHRIRRTMTPILVRSGTAAPAFGAPGGGTEHFMGQSVRDLVRSGHLRPID